MKRMTYLTGLAAALSLLVTVGHGEAHRTEQEAFGKRVLERTDGKVDISLFQFGELGLVDSDVFTIVRGGEFPLTELDHSKTAGDERLFQIFNLPGLAFSIEDAMTIAEATEDLRKKALDDWNAVEVGMAHYMPPQGIFTKKPVRTIDDLRGVGIRVYSGVLLRSFELLGSRPQLIPWGDAPAALLQGVVDGAITSPSSGISVGFGDTTKYMTVMPLSNRVSWIMNKDVWASLSPEVQKVLREEANATAERIQVNWNREEAGVAQLVKDAGMTFVPPSEEFQNAVTKLLRPVWDEWAAKTKYGPEALKLVLEALGRS